MVEKRIELTPELAKYYLAHNCEENRSAKKSNYLQIADDIRNGRWNPEISEIQDPIIISTEGELLNGQHRCLAVIETGMSVSTMVKEGVNKDVYFYLDNGMKRTPGDYIKLPEAKSLASIAKAMCAIEDGNASLSQAIFGKTNVGKRTIVVSRQQILEKVEENPDKISTLHKLGEKCRRYLGGKDASYAIAFSIINFVGRGDLISEFAEEMSLLSPTSPAVIATRSYMTRCIMSPNFDSNRKWKISCIFCAYEAFRRNSDIQSFNKNSKYFDIYEKYVMDSRKTNKEVLA